MTPFGKLPFGRVVLGDLLAVEHDCCAPFTLPAPLPEPETSFFTLVREGGCSLKRKAFNCQAAGAHLVVFFPSANRLVKDVRRDFDVDSHVPTKVPAVVVSHADGSRLAGMVGPSQELFMRFSMPLPKQRTSVIRFNARWADNRFFEVVGGFRQLARQFEDRLAAQLRFFDAGSHEAESRGLEALINCAEGDSFYGFVGSFLSGCLAKGDSSLKCLKAQVQALGMGAYLRAEECFNRKTAATPPRPSWPPSASSSFVSVNRVHFQGPLRPENLFDAVCGSFAKPPGCCLFIRDRYTANLFSRAGKARRAKRGVVAVVLSALLTVCGLAVGGLVLLRAYGRVYQRALKEKVDEIVRRSTVDYERLRSAEAFDVQA